MHESRDWKYKTEAGISWDLPTEQYWGVEIGIELGDEALDVVRLALVDEGKVWASDGQRAVESRCSGSSMQGFGQVIVTE